MIIVKLMGGLGNQMFQYAFGRALETNSNHKVFYDKSWFYQDFTGTTPRELELDKFALFPKYIKHKKPIFTGKIGRLIKILKQVVNLEPQYIKIDEKTFVPDKITLQSNYYLEGYWQNPKYFEGIREIILKDFVFPNLKNSGDITLQNKISDSESVAVHIRRGDYVNNPTTNQFHGTCSIEYYQKAAGQIVSKVPNAKFFLFTDDPDFVKNNFGFLANATVVSDSNRSDINELNLMHLCKHFIIANSSFSWWGAWLSQNPEKIIIAPKQWYKNQDANERCKIVPDNWVRL